MASKTLDLIAIGRASVDLYGQQINSRLEDITSFAKSVGGCPANVAIGASRLGLRTGFVTRVGNESMGRFIREQMAREGVALDGIIIDEQRLTALVLLAVENSSTFPLLFYRENCADMALHDGDIDPGFIASAAAVLVTGTHFSSATTAAAQKKAMALAGANGSKVIFDIDYRPNLWGLASHAAGEERYIKSERVSRHLQEILPDCDLIVGTEEEIHIAAGQESTVEALARVRSLSKGVIVLKRGPMGCVVFPDAIPARLEDGIVGQGFPIEVYNVLGAGDAFLSGFLRGYLRGEPHATSATWANACGAFAVSRLLCSPESPTWQELQYFLAHGSRERALRKDEALNHVHRATTRRPQASALMALAIDHRTQFEELADRAGVPYDRIAVFKQLAVEAASRVAQTRPGFGMLLDDVYGQAALVEAARRGLWIGRPVELPGSRPLALANGPDLGGQLVEWPVDHTVKCLAFYHPDDEPGLRSAQQSRLFAVHDAARRAGRELMLEIIAGKHGTLAGDTVARVLEELYALGIKPDWWKLEPQPSRQAWKRISDTIAANDPWCRGVAVLGLDGAVAELDAALAAAAEAPEVKGFAIGRTIFGGAAKAWLAGEITDGEAVSGMEERFSHFAEVWQRLRG